MDNAFDIQNVIANVESDEEVEKDNEKQVLLEESDWQLITLKFLNYRLKQWNWLVVARVVLFIVAITFMALFLSFYPKALRYHVNITAVANIQNNISSFNTSDPICDGANFIFDVTLLNDQIFSVIAIKEVDIRIMTGTIELANLTFNDIELVYV
jgi:hypothetical protein